MEKKEKEGIYEIVGDAGFFLGQKVVRGIGKMFKYPAVPILFLLAFIMGILSMGQDPDNQAPFM